MPNPVYTTLNASEKPRNLQNGLPDDILEAVMSRCPPSFIYQTLSVVSHGFRRVAGLVLQRLHGVQLESGAYPPYTKIAHKFDRIMKEACKGRSREEAHEVLDSCREYWRAKKILDAGFGYYIRPSEEQLMRFHLWNLPFDVLNDEKKVAVLPYYLDYWNSSEKWLYSIQGLVKRRRFDILKQLRFPKLEHKHLRMLIEAEVPVCVMETAMEAFKDGPTFELLDMLAFSGFGSWAVTMCPDWKVPVFVLYYLHRANRELPSSNPLVDGLKNEAIPFWKYVIENEAMDLLDLVRKNGDESTRMLADTLQGQVCQRKTGFCRGMGSRFDRDSYYEMRIYRAVLVRLRFSSMCNKHVVRNYQDAFEPYGKGSPVDYHALQALVDAQQCKVIAEIGAAKFINSLEQNEAAADELSQLGRLDLVAELLDPAAGLLESCVTREESLVWTVKSLVHRKANNAFIQVVLDTFETQRFQYNIDHCCKAPLKLLQRLAFEPGLSLQRVQKIMSELSAEYSTLHATRRKHIVHMLMFWEAPEAVLEYFFEQIGPKSKISDALFGVLIQSTRYSDKFIGKYTGQFGLPYDWFQMEICWFRPHLAEVLFPRRRD